MKVIDGVRLGDAICNRVLTPTVPMSITNPAPGQQPQTGDAICNRILKLRLKISAPDGGGVAPTCQRR